jgi:hypothetical protein
VETSGVLRADVSRETSVRQELEVERVDGALWAAEVTVRMRMRRGKRDTAVHCVYVTAAASLEFGCGRLI